MRTKKVLQILVLLVSGLMTAPFGSMAQAGAPEAGAALSVPHAGQRTVATTVRQSTDPRDRLSALDFTLPRPLSGEYPATIPHRLRVRPLHSAAVPLGGGRTPTYQANAPPILG